VTFGLSNPSMTLESLDDDERAKLNLGQRGLGNVNVVNKSGPYQLIVRSDRPQNRVFRRWITHTVLSQIHKTGGCISTRHPDNRHTVRAT
jgi:anti-repressor protein